MLLTRKEAGDVWCPMVRSAYCANSAAVNTTRDPADDSFNMCKSVHCAMWRWDEPERRVERQTRRPDPIHQQGPNDNSEPPRPTTLPADWVWDVDEDEGGRWLESERQYDLRVEEAALRRQGFCGLAGIPAHG